MEDAVVAIGADREGLGVVLEGVGWGLGALVDDGEFAALLEEIEGGVGAYAVDAAGGYVARDAKMADVGFVTHSLEFADGDVVALVVAATREREIGDSADDDDGSGDDLLQSFLIWRSSFPTPPLPYLILCKVFKKLDLRVDFILNTSLANGKSK